MCAVSDRLLTFLVYGNLSFLVCDLRPFQKAKFIWWWWLTLYNPLTGIRSDRNVSFACKIRSKWG